MPMPYLAKEAEPHPNCPCVEGEKGVLEHPQGRCGWRSGLPSTLGIRDLRAFPLCAGHPQGPQQPHRKVQPGGWWRRTRNGLQGLCKWCPPFIDHTAIPWPLGASKKLGNAVELCALANTLPQREAPFLPFSF